MCAAIALTFFITPVQIGADKRENERLNYYLSQDIYVIKPIYRGDYTNNILPGSSADTLAKKRAEKERRRQEILSREIKRVKSASVTNVRILYYDPIYGSNCYKFVKSQGFPSLGYHFDTAAQVKESSLQQQVGKYVVTRESFIHHFAMVIGETDTEIIVRDGNYIVGFISERHIRKDSGLIRGYIN